MHDFVRLRKYFKSVVKTNFERPSKWRSHSFLAGGSMSEFHYGVAVIAHLLGHLEEGVNANRLSGAALHSSTDERLIPKTIRKSLSYDLNQKESSLLKDAKTLMACFQKMKYSDWTGKKRFPVKARFENDSAKKLYSELKETSSNDWWTNLSETPRKGTHRDVVNFIWECLQLNDEARSGWTRPHTFREVESVGEHQRSAAIMARVAAHLSGHPDPDAVLVAGLFHDLQEARLQDRHWLSKKYLPTPREVENTVLSHQLNRLPLKIRSHLERLLLSQSEQTKSVLKAGDQLSIAFQARKMKKRGVLGVDSFVPETWKLPLAEKIFYAKKLNEPVDFTAAHA